MTFILLCNEQPVEGQCPAGSQAWVGVNEAFTPGDLGIDAAGVLSVASWGVGVVLLLWSLGYGVASAVRVIRSV